MTDNNAKRDPTRDQDWEDIANQWQVRDDTCYLNHGSFGISPEPVRACRREWIERLDCQPMDFYLRQLEPAFHETRDTLAEFLRTQASHLVFVENATYGMNIVANGMPLKPGDEVLLTSHEYGAVKRIWERRCNETGAAMSTAVLKLPFTSTEQVLEELFAQATPQTKLLIVSHITSETGTILPVGPICQRARELGIAVCIDGPHAPAQVSLDLSQLDCDFYTASCHKWLCAPLGTGFLFVDPRWQNHVEPLVQSWGRLKPNEPQRWDEEMIWMGTRDPSAFFSIKKAIEFLGNVGFDNFRRRTHWLAKGALNRLSELFQTEPNYPLEDDPYQWFGSMCELPLPQRMSGDELSTIQWRLWDNHGIEVPVFEFENQAYLRVSFHLYNSTRDIDHLLASLEAEKCHA